MTALYDDWEQPDKPEFEKAVSSYGIYRCAGDEGFDAALSS